MLWDLHEIVALWFKLPLSTFTLAAVVDPGYAVSSCPVKPTVTADI